MLFGHEEVDPDDININKELAVEPEEQAEEEKDSELTVTVKKAERLTSAIIYTAYSAALCLFFALSALFGGLEGYYFFVSALFASAAIIFFADFTKKRKKAVYFTESAAEYFSIFAKKSKFARALPYVAVIGGLALWGINPASPGLLISFGGASALVSVVIKDAFIKRIKTGDPLPDGKYEDYSRKREITRAITLWIIYWIFFIGLYALSVVLFGSYLFYIPILVFALINFVIRLIINNPYRKYAAIRGKRMTVRLFSYGLFAAALFYGLSLIDSGVPINYYHIKNLDYSEFSHNSEVFYDAESGVYTVRASKEGEFRILQLTDIHLCGSITAAASDKKSIDACYATIKQAKPDLIIVTGDIAYPVPIQSFTKDNYVPFWHFCEFMDRVGIPWAFVYGNHDTESNARYDAEGLSSLFRSYSFVEWNSYKTDGSLLYSSVKPDIYGRYNNYIRIENSRGELERLVFLIDSNDYVPGSNKVNEYDTVRTDQIDWYENTVRSESGGGKTVRSFVFMHIPFKEFADAYEDHLNGGSTEYLFGQNGETPSYPDTDNGFFGRIVDIGSTDAVFVGHDHMNSLAVKYMGVDLVYGRAIDYIAYPKIAHKKGHRGGVLIKLLPDGYSLEPVVYDE